MIKNQEQELCVQKYIINATNSPKGSFRNLSVFISAQVVHAQSTQYMIQIILIFEVLDVKMMNFSYHYPNIAYIVSGHLKEFL
jgi:hypothetical protein